MIAVHIHHGDASPDQLLPIRHALFPERLLAEPRIAYPAEFLSVKCLHAVQYHARYVASVRPWIVFLQHVRMPLKLGHNNITGLLRGF